MTPPSPFSTLFPYTTLFRSVVGNVVTNMAVQCRDVQPYCRIVRQRGFRGCRDSLVPSPERVNHDIHEILVVERCGRSEEHTSELQSRQYLVCRLLLEKKKKK